MPPNPPVSTIPAPRAACPGESQGASTFSGWFAIPALLAVFVFAAIVSQGTGHFLAHESLGSFYDAQARSLLHGRLDVPPESIQAEGFLHDGKWYGYFGPTPALLRLPFALVGVHEGQLSRLFLLGYFVAALLASYRILQALSRQLPATESPSRLGIVLFTLNVGLGSTLLFLSSRAYVYHEAILCGVAFALWSVAATARYLETAATRSWVAALVCGVLSIQARAPTGLFALTCLLLAALLHAWRRWRCHTPLGACRWVAFAAVVGVLSFNAVSYLKFGTFEGCPLRMNVQYTPERLAAIGGREFHLRNLPYGASAYLGWHARLTPHFPYVEMSAPDPSRYPGARLDLTDGILGLPFAMAGLTVAAILGLFGALRSPKTAMTSILAVVWVAAVPLGVAMFAAIAVAHRYTADFCPFLIAAAAVGIARMERPSRQKPRGWAALGLATVVAIPLTLALTLDFQGARVWGVPTAVRQRYADLRQWIDQAVGQPDPHGYDATRLPVVMTDRRTAQTVIMTMTADPNNVAKGIAVSRALAADFPEDPTPRLQLALLLCNAGRLAEGTAAFDTLLQRFPDFAPGHYYRAILYARTERFREAERELETATTLDPRNPEYRQALAALRAAERSADARSR